MGTMCRIAEQFFLSHGMYEIAVQMFKKSHDEIAYYYALNDMAFVLCEKEDLSSAIKLIETIEAECSDSSVLSLTLLTKSEAYLKACCFDTLLYYAQQLSISPYYSDYADIFLAQAYDNLHIKDSALVYARKVIAHPHNANEQFNANYIVIYNDSTLNDEDVRRLSSEREDIRFYSMEPMKNQCTIASDILLHDVENNSDYLVWLFAIILGICATSLAIMMFFRTRHKLQRVKIERGHLQQASKILQQQTADLLQQHSLYNSQYILKIEDICETIRISEDWRKQLAWKNYEEMCDVVNKNFNLLASKLQATGILSEKEIRLCVLVLLGYFTDKQLAAALFYGEKSIRGMKRYVAKKLGTTSAHLREFLIEKTIGTAIRSPQK